MTIQTVLIVGLVSVRFFGQIRMLVRKKNCLYRRNNIILDFFVIHEISTAVYVAV